MTNNEYAANRKMTPIFARQILMDSRQDKYELADLMAAEWVGAKTLEKEIPRARFQYRCGVCDLDVSECDWGDESCTLREVGQFNYCPRCGQKIDWEHDDLFDREHVIHPSEYDNPEVVKQKKEKLFDDKDYWYTQDTVFGTPRWYFSLKDEWMKRPEQMMEDAE